MFQTRTSFPFLGNKMKTKQLIRKKKKNNLLCNIYRTFNLKSHVINNFVLQSGRGKQQGLAFSSLREAPIKMGKEGKKEGTLSESEAALIRGLEARV